MESSLTPFFLPHLVFNASRNVSAGLCVQNLAISHHSHCDHHGPCLSCELRQSPPPGPSSSRLSRLCLNTEASIKTQVRSRSFSPQNHSSSPCVTGSTFLSCPRLLFLLFRTPVALWYILPKRLPLLKSFPRPLGPQLRARKRLIFLCHSVSLSLL